MNIDPRLIRKARSSRLPFLLTVVFGFAGGILIVFQARLLSRIIAGVFLDGKTLPAVSGALWVLAGVILGRALLAFGSELAANTTAVLVKTGLRIELLAHLQQQGPAYTQGEHSGELTTTALDGVEALQAYFGQYLPQVLLAALIPLTILGIVFPLDFLSGLVLVLTAPLIPVFMVLIGNASASLTHKQYTALTRLSAHFLDMLQGLATLKALNQNRSQARSIARVSEQYRQTTMGVLRVTFLSALVLELVSTISTAIVAVQVGLRLLYGRLGFEEALFILIIAPEFYLPLRNLGLRFHAGMSGTSAARRIFEILETPLPEPVRASSSRDHPLAPAKAIFPLQFEQVSYAYLDGKRPAVNEISFTIQSGQKTALVGPSGAGKSTVMQLLLGFIRPDSGCILSHGVDLTQVPMDWWRSQIAWVPQTPYLFHDTLLYNLRLARPAASMDEIRQAARLAHLDEWVDRLPDGYNTDIGEGGARLSGGQAQRVALARAFLRETPLLLLDEPTASLDPEQEYLLEQATQALAAHRTVITIAHRLNTIAQADQILVFAGGQIVERGKHEALLKSGNLYASLVQHYRGNE